MRRIALFVSFLLVAIAVAASAGTVTTYTDVNSFNAAVGATTLEDFTAHPHFPISTGVLNSFTDLPGIGIYPGMIQPGVTYSVPVTSGYFFNIDAGGGFNGGFLDSVTGDSPLSVAFVSPEAAFGFVTNFLGGTSQTVVLSFANGSTYSYTYGIPGDLGLNFIGFQSSGTDITGLTLSGAGGFSSTFGFAIDNFQFGGAPSTATPEPSGLVLLGSGLVAAAGVIRRKLSL